MNTIRIKSLCFLLSITLFFSCVTEKNDPINADLVLHNVSVIDLKADTVYRNYFISIVGDSILGTGSMSNIPDYETDNIIDLNGKFALPGFWDNHVHFRGGTTLIKENKNLLKLFLNFGITSVRDAGGDLTPSVLEWRKETKQKPEMGPTIYTSGPKLDGPNPAWEGSIKIENIGDIHKALDSLSLIQADYVKIYDGSLSADNFYAIIKEAEKRGLKVTGHMPLSADLLKAAELGLDGSEHLYYYLKSCSSLTNNLPDSAFNYGMFNEVLQTFKDKKAKISAGKLAVEEVFVTPTLYIGKVLSELAYENHETDSLLKYIGDVIQATYQRRLKAAKKAADNGNTMRSTLDSLNSVVIPILFNANVDLLAGSDCGPYNSFVYPGESLWGELFLLKEKGLNERAILMSSIVNGPKFLNLSQHYGSIEKGKIADINIFDENPLSNIENIRSLETVIHRGKIVRN